MTEVSSRIVVGRFGRPHGIKGAIVVHSFTDPEDTLLQYMPWQICRSGRWQDVSLIKADVQGRLILAQVEGYSTREDVASLTNLDIAVDRTLLPPLPEGEYYWFDLVGMEVVTSSGVLLGTVTELMPTGANDVLVIDGKKRHLVPWLIERVVQVVDMQHRRITVDWDPDF